MAKKKVVHLVDCNKAGSSECAGWEIVIADLKKDGYEVTDLSLIPGFKNFVMISR